MTIFFRLLKTEIEAKGTQLAEQVKAANAKVPAPDAFAVEPSDFGQIPGSPFAYWVDSKIRHLFRELPRFEDSETVARVTNPTADNFRFLRNFWECPPNGIGRMEGWVPYAKGGEGKKFFCDINLVVAWDDEQKTYRGYTGTVHRPDLRPANLGFFFKEGIAWPLRASQLCAQVFPSGSAFSARSQCLFAPREKLPYYLGLLNSFVMDYLFKLALGRFGFPEFLVGVLRNLPKPIATPDSFRKTSEAGIAAYQIVQQESSTEETTHVFSLPAVGQYLYKSLKASGRAVQDARSSAMSRLAELQKELDLTAAHLYGLNQADYEALAVEQTQPALDYGIEATGDEENDDGDTSSDVSTQKSEIENLLMWSLGSAFGRWDVRFALDPSLLPKLQEPFDPLPRCSPGMLIGADSLPPAPNNIVSEEWLRARPNVITLPPDGTVEHPTIADSEYPLKINWDGIIPDDESHPEDIVRRVREVLELLWKDRAEPIEQEACEILGVHDLRDYFRSPSGFFADHLKRYSKSRRQAPIYWPLSTASGSYTVWVYYHRLTKDKLYTIVTKYVTPKIESVEKRADQLTDKLKDASGKAATELRDQLYDTKEFLSELNDFRAELLSVAQLPYKPDLNDGVIITAAPLNKLFRLRKWANDTAAVWKKLEAGEYDWAHMAYNIWPKRVEKKCETDRSNAIAHGLEHLCKAPVKAAKKPRRGKKQQEEEPKEEEPESDEEG